MLLYSEQVSERIFRFYGVRFQIGFAFRDAKQHLGLNGGQARSQAKLHFHFNVVFAALFWARRQVQRPLAREPTRRQIQGRLQSPPAGTLGAARISSQSKTGP
ncbi:MAG: hypothetical protein F4Y80_09100 [Caldilineaceae bacterium SB0665_bin_21]|nr:hypothetical protein [Caldilineaceae bacterium SB0665_bin_21]